MAVPPAYADLGKSAKDIFSKGYGFGTVKLDLKTKSQSGVEFNTSGSSNTDTGKAAGTLETKYKAKDLGLSFSQKWNTDNNLTSEITLEDQLAQGLKLTFDTSFVPNTGKKSGKLKTGYKRDYMNLGCDVDFDFAGPTVHAAAVLGYEGWLAGYQMAFDTAKSKLAQNNFALGYKAGDFQLHTNVNDGTEFGGSIYHLAGEAWPGAAASWCQVPAGQGRVLVCQSEQRQSGGSRVHTHPQARSEGHSLRAGRRQELQRRGAQGGARVRAGGVGKAENPGNKEPLGEELGERVTKTQIDPEIFKWI
ncbi:hypothetical protein ANANG_G00187060 [Anguilla anguilla]|uniref:Non-selective voltage-gated ion channel VDAC3 n=1 Tax=Anguilla anguilla TaxID=7936 RepID=A0A9D3M3Z0_ANGAN|nr:hypothetical protein ANANG_G00187060 [Anguilla anguilla]